MPAEEFSRTIIKTASRRQKSRSGLLVPAQVLIIGFAVAILIGTLLLHLPASSQSNESLPLIDCLFTATSAVCVTGLVVVDTGTTFSLFGQLVILILIQVGGLGIMTMTTLLALLMGRKINLRERLIMQEALNVLSLSGVVRLTRHIICFTIATECTGVLLLAFRFVPQFGLKQGLYLSIFHAVSAFCNAGFDVFGPITGPYSNLTAFVEDPLVTLVIAGLIVIGGIGFSVITDIYSHHGFSRLSLHSKMAISMTVLLIVLGTVFILALEYNRALAGVSPRGMLLSSIFQSVTTRTAGYNTIRLAGLQTATGVIMIILMFIGASPGGTGGGIKTTTFATLLLGVKSIISGRRELSVFRRRLPIEQLLKSLAIASLAAFLVITITLSLTLTEHADLLTLSFETVSAFGTVGLTLGLTPHLSLTGKLLIAFTMFAGRLGPLTIGVAIWGRQVKMNYHYPEERIIIG